MFPEPTELLLIGCLIESIWITRSKSNTLTPKTHSQTHWQREISHVMNGITFCTCSTSPISDPSIILKWCRKERQKMQVKNVSQQNRSWWWIWSRNTAQGIQTCLPRLHQKARGKPYLVVKYLWARGMSSNQERGDLCWALPHQTTQNGEMLEARTVRPVGGQPTRTQTSLSSMTMMRTLTPTELNLSLKSRSFLHRVNDRVRKMLDQSSKDAIKTVANILWSGECSCLQHWKDLHTWERITQKIYIPSKKQGTVWLWNRCLTSEKLIVVFGQWWRSHHSLACKGCVFSDSVLCLRKVNQNPTSNTVWEQQLGWLKDSSQCRTLDTIDREPMEFEWNIFPGFTTLQLVEKV